MLDAAIRSLIFEAVREALDARAEVEAAIPGGKHAMWEPEAADWIGIKPHALRDLRRKGLIDGCKLGGRICYRRQDLIELLEKQRMGK